MKEKTYLEPLKIYLSEEISPKQLSHLLDELAFDYSQKIVLLDLAGGETALYIHEETSHFLYHLKRLRDVLRKCKA